VAFSLLHVDEGQASLGGATRVTCWMLASYAWNEHIECSVIQYLNVVVNKHVWESWRASQLPTSPTRHAASCCLLTVRVWPVAAEKPNHPTPHHIVAHILPGSAIAEVDLLWHYKLCGIVISKGTRVLYLSATRANRIPVHCVKSVFGSTRKHNLQARTWRPGHDFGW
jgi:hypothetical protein